MRKFVFGVIAAAALAMLGWAMTCIFIAPAEPAFDWQQHMSGAEHDALVARIDHLYRVAAYSVTWAIQLGYLAWVGLKWRKQTD